MVSVARHWTGSDHTSTDRNQFSEFNGVKSAVTKLATQGFLKYLS